MQRLTDVPLTFRTANRVGDATDFFRGQLLDAPRPERDGREDRLEGLRRRRQGLPTESEVAGCAIIRRANSHWYIRTARRNGSPSRRNVSGDEIWYGRFEAITSKRGHSIASASPSITSTSGRLSRRYAANRRSASMATT